MYKGRVKRFMGLVGLLIALTACGAAPTGTVQQTGDSLAVATAAPTALPTGVPPAQHGPLPIMYFVDDPH